MDKLTGIYEITIPNIPINDDEVSKQKPIIIKNDDKLIKIYPPGHDCKRVWKSILGKNLPVEIVISEGGTKYADSLHILIEKNALFPDGTDLDPVYKNINTEVENITHKIMKLLRKQLPLTPINIPSQFQYKSIYKINTKSKKNHYLGGESKGIKVKYHSPDYYLSFEKWSALKKALRNNEDIEIWQDFLYDADISRKEGELSKAIIFSSIGYEIFIKEYTEKSYHKTGLSVDFWKYLKRRQPRVLDYYDSILKLITGHSLKVENQECYASLERLNTARNDIVHEGKLSRTSSEIKQLKKDLNNVVQVISWVNSLKRSKLS